MKYYKRWVMWMGESAIHLVPSLAGLACPRNVEISFTFPYFE